MIDAEERYYIVVLCARPTLSSVVLVLATVVGLPARAQQPPGAANRPTPLVPAETLWSVTLQEPPSAAAAMDASSVFVASRAGAVMAFARDDGRQLWSVPLSTSQPPVVAHGAVYLATKDAVSALDPATGRAQWQVQPGESPGLLASAGDALAAVVGGRTLVVLAAVDGHELWRAALPDVARHAPASDGRHLVVTLMDGRVLAFRRDDGSLAWQRILPGQLAPPAVASGLAVVGSTTNEVFALRLTTGAIAWRWRVGGDVVGVAGDDVLVIASLDNVIRAVRTGSGNQRWKKPVGSRPAYPPLIVAGHALVTSVSPLVSVYLVASGALEGTYQAPAELAGPALAGPAGTMGASVVVLTRDGRLIGLRTKPEEKTSPPAARP